MLSAAMLRHPRGLAVAASAIIGLALLCRPSAEGPGDHPRGRTARDLGASCDRCRRYGPGVRRRADLIVLAVVTTLVVPLLAIATPARGLILTVPVLTGVAVGVFIRRTARPVGVTLTFAVVPSDRVVGLDRVTWTPP